jgi:hypothetical protein
VRVSQSSLGLLVPVDSSAPVLIVYAESDQVSVSPDFIMSYRCDDPCLNFFKKEECISLE